MIIFGTFTFVVVFFDTSSLFLRVRWALSMICCDCHWFYFVVVVSGVLDVDGVNSFHLIGDFIHCNSAISRNFDLSIATEEFCAENVANNAG